MIQKICKLPQKKKRVIPSKTNAVYQAEAELSLSSEGSRIERKLQERTLQGVNLELSARTTTEVLEMKQELNEVTPFASSLSIDSAISDRTKPKSSSKELISEINDKIVETTEVTSLKRAKESVIEKAEGSFPRSRKLPDISFDHQASNASKFNDHAQQTLALKSVNEPKINGSIEKSSIATTWFIKFWKCKFEQRNND